MRPARLMTIWLLVAAAVCHSSARAENSVPGPKRPHAGEGKVGHEFWIISTRHLGYSERYNPQRSDLDVREFTDHSGWVDSSFDDFLSRERKLTVVYAHANRWDWYDVFREGPQFYTAITSCATDGPPIRFVIWTWPADRIPGLIRDVRIKAERADAEGSIFGWFLSELDPDVPVSLIGFSYGARVISGGLQLLSGGTLNGQRLPTPPMASDRHIRAIYFAAAMDRYWLANGGYHSDSLYALDALLVLYNCCDPALKRFRFSDPCTRPTALGYAGIPWGAMGPGASIVSELDVSSIVGRTHDERRYWTSGTILNEVCRFAIDSMPLVSSELAEESLAESADEAPVRDAEDTDSPVVTPASAEPAHGSTATVMTGELEVATSAVRSNESDRRIRRPLSFLRGRR